MTALVDAFQRFHRNDNIDFNPIAELLFNNCIIQSRNRKFRINEIEFYYFSDNHRDPFAYKKPPQKEMGSWYFHDSGIDITFGQDGNYASVLIRGIQDTVSHDQFDGPLLVFYALFNLGHDINCDIELKVIKHTLPKSKFNNGPRVNISKKLGERDRLYYSVAPYRYILKDFYTEKGKYLIALAYPSISKENPPRTLKLDKHTYMNHYQEFENGLNKQLDLNELRDKKDLTTYDRAKLFGYYMRDDAQRL